MSTIFQVIKKLPESYLLNIPQMFHMAVLAGFVPWYIGVENYGRFAAVIAIPALFQSIFEAFCVTILIRYQIREVLKPAIVFVVFPLVVLVSILFTIFLPLLEAILATLMTVFLFGRSYTFAVAISSGIMTRAIIKSEFLILIFYFIIILFCAQFEVRDITLPMAMIGVASAASFFQLQYEMRHLRIMSKNNKKENVKALPRKIVIQAIMTRAYEDGLLTLSPLLLALTVSTTMAGQFRILVSAIKVAYKFFPYRYEVVLRDVGSGRQSFYKLFGATIFVSVVSVITGIIVYFLILPKGYQWLTPLVAVSGAVVSCLAIYPVSCVKDGRISLALIAGIFLTYLLTSLLSIFGFLLGFCITSYFIMISSLVVIRKEIGYSHA